jgi:hypothetical protein
MNHTGDNNDATKNTEESQKPDNLDALPPSESSKHANSNVIYSICCVYILAAQNEAILITPTICENDIQHTSQTIAQLDFHSNNKEINTDPKGELFYS